MFLFFKMTVRVLNFGLIYSTLQMNRIIENNKKIMFQKYAHFSHTYSHIFKIEYCIFIYIYVYMYIYIYRVIPNCFFNKTGVMVHIKPNHIKWEIKSPKHFPKELTAIKI